MSLQQWNKTQIQQFKDKTGQALLCDESTLVSFSYDFGKMQQVIPAAVSIPDTTESLQTLITYASEHRLPVTIRGNGLSQHGQSLPVNGGLTLSMCKFNQTLQMANQSIWVEANTSWSDLLKKTVPHGLAPYVLPYNCNLAVAGVLSVGGVGASSFKHSVIAAHVDALEVIDGTGTMQTVDKESPLFHACLGGQGRFGVITKACIQLRPVKPQVKTVALVYADHQQWLADMERLKDRADYMELFCSPSLQGSKLQAGRRSVLAQWLYGLHFSVEYHDKSPDLAELLADLTPWRVLNSQDESILSYFLRHNPRFEQMKALGQWDLFHPWYECFVPTHIIRQSLAELLEQLPVHYASLVHVVPVAKKQAGFLMFPEEDSFCSLMMLHPGISQPLLESCIQTVHTLDAHFLPLGAKRYLSGFLGHDLDSAYWKTHFASQHEAWNAVKKRYDPQGIFRSDLHRE